MLELLRLHDCTDGRRRAWHVVEMAQRRTLMDRRIEIADTWMFSAYLSSISVRVGISARQDRRTTRYPATICECSRLAPVFGEQ